MSALTPERLGEPCDYHAALFTAVHAKWDRHMTPEERDAWADGIARQCPRCCDLPERKHVPRGLEEP